MFRRMYLWLRTLLAALRFKFGKDVRLAHAYRSVPDAKDLDDLEEVVAILRGEQSLEPRTPADVGAVRAAETLLGVAPPVYTFAGCLHPELGTIGLIISPKCLAQCLQGVSKCDSGGLAGRKGDFSVLAVAEASAAVTDLACTNGGWATAFSRELAASYVWVRDYVGGILPNHAWWNDVRSSCIAASLDTNGAQPDRRLWTWEVRLATAPDHSHFEGIVLSPEAFKKLDSLVLGGITIPEGIRVARGSVGPGGVHHFNGPAVIDMLCGKRGV